MNTDTKFLNKIKCVGTSGYQNKEGRKEESWICPYNMHKIEL